MPTPWVVGANQTPGALDPLPTAGQRVYASGVGSMSYYATDRTEIQWTVRVLAQTLATPTELCM